MLRFGGTKIAKENFLCQKKKTKKNSHINFDNIVILKLAGTKSNSKYLIRNLDKSIRTLVLILPKMSGYVKR